MNVTTKRFTLVMSIPIMSIFVTPILFRPIATTKSAKIIQDCHKQLFLHDSQGPSEGTLSAAYEILITPSLFNCMKLHYSHCVKSVRIRSHSGPYFPAFGLNAKRYSVSLLIQSEYGKIRTRITPNTDTLYTGVFHMYFCQNSSQNFLKNSIILRLHQSQLLRI